MEVWVKGLFQERKKKQRCIPPNIAEYVRSDREDHFRYIIT